MTKKPKLDPEEFFLGERFEPDNVRFVPNFRRNRVEPLIDGEQAFSKMAELVTTAKESVWIASWIMNLEVPLIQTVKVGGKRVSKWIDLFREVAKSGVEVRILLSDFDPILQNNYHQTVWTAYSRIIQARSKLPAILRKNLQCYVSRHQATIRQVAASIQMGPLKELAAKWNKLKASTRNNNLRRSPGLWSLVSFNRKRGKPIRIKSDARFVAFPASHHQKYFLIDGHLAILGGLDIQKGRVDNRKHDKMLWHDINVLVDGKSSSDIGPSFLRRWNSEIGPFKKFLKEANALKLPFSVPEFTVEPLQKRRPKTSSKKTPPTNEQNGLVQVHRTVSVDDIFGTVPSNVTKQIEIAYKKAIFQATKFIYIENQYVRAELLAEWIVNRRRDAPNLQVIVLIPIAPEEVLEKKIDAITNHGLFLQHKTLMRLQKQLGDDVGIYSLLSRKKPNKKGRFVTTKGRLQVYVHSKLLIIDDNFAHIGSANANLRSFRMDTELGIGWLEPANVRRFRLDLWNELLGKPKGMAAWKQAEFNAKWRDISNHNLKSSAAKQKGFVIPHDVSKFPGKKDSRIPDEFANFDLGSDQAEREELV